MSADENDGRCDCWQIGIPTCATYKNLPEPERTAHRKAAYAAEIRRRADYQDAHGKDPLSVERRLQQIGVPASALLAIRKKPQDTQALEGARRFLASPRELFPLLALVGVPGCGKTVAASWVLQRIAANYPWDAMATGQERVPALFLPANRLTRLSSFDTADRELYERARRKVGVLVLDDLGNEGTDFARGHVVDLLLERADENRRTIITSNLTPEAFRQRYGDALFDRLKSRAIFPALKQGSMRRRPEARP